jgi:hypothetical protein
MTEVEVSDDVDDVEGEPVAEVDAGPEVVEAPPATRLPVWSLILMAALLIVAVGASVIAANADASRRRAANDRAAVADTSGRLATALSTYDYRSFDATKQRVLRLATGSFAGEYEKAVGALASLITETKATSEATVSDVFVGEIADGKARSIVVVEIRGTGLAGPRVSVDNYVELSLVKVEGVWKVDGVSNLNLGVASTPTAGGGSSTSAPAPATTTSSVG